MMSNEPVILGYFSQKINEDGSAVAIEPQWKYPNKEAFQRINNGTPETFNENQQTRPPRFSTSNDPIIQYLNENVREWHNCLQGEYIVLCRASVLFSMLYYGEEDEKKKSTKFFKVRKSENGIVTLERDTNETEPELTNDIGHKAEEVLIESSEQEKLQLYVVVKHEFKVNGNPIILYLSKEIDFIPRNEQPNKITALDLKVNVFYRFATAEGIEKYGAKNLIMDWLANGITYVYGTLGKKPKDGIHRVTVMEGISRLCDSQELSTFKEKLGPLLYKICQTNLREFKIQSTASNVSRINNEGMNPVLSKVVPHPENYVPYVTYEPAEHILVILGDYHIQIKSDYLYCHSDVITLQSFIDKKYDGLLKTPTKIVLYGTQDNLAKAQASEHRLQIELVEAPQPQPNQTTGGLLKYYYEYFLNNYFSWFRRHDQD